MNKVFSEATGSIAARAKGNKAAADSKIKVQVPGKVEGDEMVFMDAGREIRMPVEEVLHNWGEVIECMMK